MLGSICKIAYNKNREKLNLVAHEDVLMAYQKRAVDFEDCLLALCAENINCDYIITRNKADFDEFNIPTLEPAELLKKIL